MGKNDKDVSFAFNKYNEPQLRDRKVTVANAIINACFMVPGNIPSMPDVGVNIKQYFYKEESAITADKIRLDLEKICGKVLAGAVIGKVDFSVQSSGEGDTIFLLLVTIKFSFDDEEMLGISMQQSATDYVRFNFDYVNISGNGNT